MAINIPISDDEFALLDSIASGAPPPTIQKTSTPISASINDDEFAYLDSIANATPTQPSPVAVNQPSPPPQQEVAVPPEQPDPWNVSAEFMSDAAMRAQDELSKKPSPSSQPQLTTNITTAGQTALQQEAARPKLPTYDTSDFDLISETGSGRGIVVPQEVKINQPVYSPAQNISIKRPVDAGKPSETVVDTPTYAIEKTAEQVMSHPSADRAKLISENVPQDQQKDVTQMVLAKETKDPLEAATQTALASIYRGEKEASKLRSGYEEYHATGGLKKDL